MPLRGFGKLAGEPLYCVRETGSDLQF